MTRKNLLATPLRSNAEEEPAGYTPGKEEEEQQFV
jgi:hypothetical protein